MSSFNTDVILSGPIRSQRMCGCVCRTRQFAAIVVHGAEPRLSPHWPAEVVTSEPDLCPSEPPAPPPTPLRRQGEEEEEEKKWWREGGEMKRRRRDGEEEERLWRGGGELLLQGF